MTLLTRDDLDGLMDAFGEVVTHKSATYQGVIANDYQQTEFGSVRLSSNAPVVTLISEDVDTMQLALNDTLTFRDADYIVKEIQPDGYEQLTEVRVIESA